VPSRNLLLQQQDEHLQLMEEEEEQRQPWEEKQRQRKCWEPQKEEDLWRHHQLLLLGHQHQHQHRLESVGIAG